MKKKSILSAILAFVIVLISSNVNAAIYTTKLELPKLDEIKDTNIEAHAASFGGYSYNMIYGIDNFMRYGMNDDGTYDGSRNYNDGQGSDSSLPYPFDLKISENFGGGAPIGVFAMAFSSRTDSLLMQYANAFSAGYCIGWGVPFGDYEEANPFTTTRMKEYAFYELSRARNGEAHTPSAMRAINYVLTYGYQYPVVGKNDMYWDMPASYRYMVMDGMHWYVAEVIKDYHRECTATQYAAWIASNDFMVDDPTNREKIENYFFNGKNVRKDGVDQVYIGIRNKILAAMRMPSYSYATEDLAKENAIELKWSEDNKRFEAIIPDSNSMSKVEKVKLSYSEADASLNFEQQADGSLLIWTKSVVGNLNDPEVLNVTKEIEGAKECMVISKSQNKSFQPIAMATDGQIIETQPMAVYTQALRISVEKDLVDINGKYGDASVEGCEFTVYSDANCTQVVGKLTVGKNGKTGKTTYLPYQTYYLKETKNSESTIRNNTVYTVDPETAATDSDGDFLVCVQAENEIVPTRLRVIKYRNESEETEESPAQGAVLRLELESNPAEYHIAVVDKLGVAVFENIPYGKYILKEDDTNSNYHLKIDPVTISMTVHQDRYTYQKIVSDDILQTFLKVVKIDSVSKKPIQLEGAEFKIWDIKNNEWVSQLNTPSDQYIDTFVTNENGEFITPAVLDGGEYIVYETKAPKGYYLNPKYAIPKNTADLGDLNKGGIKLSLTTNLVLDEDERGNLIYTFEIENEPLKGKLELFKTGEVLTDADMQSTEYGDKYTPVYTIKGLENATFEIYAAQDIKSTDGTYTYVTKGTKVDTITTGEDGYATTKDLYLGEYEIRETVTPVGYVPEDKIENVVLKNEDENVKSELTKKSVNNIRQKLKLTIPKTYDEITYVTEEGKDKYSVFGVYANEDIKNSEGRIVISKNDLVDVIRIDGIEPDVTSTIDLPAAKYYIQELETSYPYLVSEDIVNIELKHAANGNEYITTASEGFHNTYDKAAITLIKVSSSSLQNVIINGSDIIVEDMDVQLDTMIEDIKGMTEDEIKDYLDEKDIDYVAGAEYSVFLDEDCTKPLLVKNEAGEFVQAKLVTNKTGLIKVEGLPIGKYYLKETFAPTGYAVSEDVIEISLTREDKDSTVYTALVDEEITDTFLTKTDIFTGEPIANCIFEIRDEDGKLLLHSVTDEEGRGYIPVVMFENGKTYTYTEVEAPDIYDLNTEPHEFVAEFEVDEANGKYVWTGEDIKVENRRKTIDELIIRKVDDETGKPLQGCKFSIILIDEEGNPVLDPNGENVYLVKEAVTGEDGEYIVEKPYYGIYQFIEVEAPEGYELKVDMEGMTFEINEESPETIIFEVTNTGDIAVYALAAVAVVSVLGIVFVILRNRKRK